ncbi:uncharacterized protein LOC114534591 [Dendronephthya gigantea]|uniref:uncharacterized protein LOC114534591 n=1 Tax=Dendronephthya gigantea TaxID=151771 RepID=UPI00106D04FC|nr:uncharacterized protein LOC114534591 [Dendronephthya gigantea]
MAELFQLVFILWCSRIFTNAQSSKVTKTIVTSSMNVSTPTSLPPSEDLKKSNIGLIIAVSFGAAGLIVLIILTFLLCYKRRRQFLDEAQNPPELGRDAGHSDNMVKKIITMDGGVLEIADIKLSIGPECLANDTEVTVIKDDQNFAFQSLINMNLIEDTPTIVKFFPDGLKFLNPANLTVKLKKIVPNSKLHVLHGFRDPYSKRMVWELVINDIDVNESEGFVNMKIEGFSLYSFIVATCGFVGRLLSHLNQSFACCAYALYRRQPLTGLIDISVVFVSDFVENTHGENIKQLQDHLKEDYVKGGKGMMKRIDTSRSLEMSLNFPHHKSDSYEFRINPSELDKYGFVVDKFTGTEIEYPAAGNVVILEEYDSSWSELWKLKVREGGRGIAQQPSCG